METVPRILIAGIGNIFLGDDAFGVEVARRMVRRPLPGGVRVVDFGIRGIDLTYALLDGCDVAILVDAVPRQSAPGTLFVIEPHPDHLPETDPGLAMIEAHNLDPARVLAVVKSLGGQVRRVLLVGCEPTPINEQEMQMELSPPVLAAIEPAIALIESLVGKVLQEADLLALPAGSVASA